MNLGSAITRRACPALLALIAATPSFSAPAVFYGIGQLSGGAANSQVRDAVLTSSGILAVGNAQLNSVALRGLVADTAVIWTPSGGLVSLPTLGSITVPPGGRFETASQIAAGNYVIASRASSDPKGHDVLATLYTPQGAVKTVIGESPGMLYSAANAISSNAKIVYGFEVDSSFNYHGFRWTASSGLVELPGIAGYPSLAPSGHGASQDGSVDVGAAFTSGNGYNPGSVAFVYRHGQGTTTLPFPPGGTWAGAFGVAPGGHNIVGCGDTPANPNGEVLLWHNGVVETLGVPAAEAAAGIATNFGGVTSGGNVVVVAGLLGSYLHNSHGWFDLQTALEAAGADLTGWSLLVALGVDGDGTLVYGDGTHSGGLEGFVAQVPAGFLGHFGGGLKLYGIGQLPGANSAYSEVRDATLAGNQIIAVGNASTNATQSGDESVMWSLTGGLVALPDVVPNSASTIFITASAITPDGAAIASRAHLAALNSRVAVRVTQGGTVNTVLGEFPGSPLRSAATAISDNGNVLYGFGANVAAGNNLQAFRWTESTGLVAIPFLPGDNNNGPVARGTSADGRVMLGESDNSPILGGFGPGTHSFRYVHGAGVKALPNLSGGTWTSPLALSADGTLALGVGDSTAAPMGEAMLWQENDPNAVSLGTPDATTMGPSNFGGMTSDGVVAIVDFYDSTGAGGPYVHNSNGWFALQSALASEGLDLTGWSLDSALGVSRNGRLIFGSGMHNGKTEGWVVEVPAGFLAKIGG